ncbi:MAG TPA: TetR/AcrR family transcriptional regulator [Solirubrobacterales bacterium]|nr:TetR/AcrR family transcriptional regulator [Solirubrobacterales bacterium]
MPGSDKQRERLLDAMVTVAARHGCGGASVARVIREAGVSRATFYEHFADREDCFLAAFRRLAKRMREMSAKVDTNSPRPGVAELLAWAARDPAAARFFLIEALADSEKVRAESRKLRSHLAGRAAELLASGSPAGRIELSAEAMAGGVYGIVGVRAFRGESSQLPELCDDLLVWVGSYSLGEASSGPPVAWKALGASLLPEPGLPPPLAAVLDEGPLPRGRGALPAAVVAERQRLRILAATARLCRESGYTPMSVKDLVSVAGVSRAAFYEQFRDKLDAFLAAQSFALEQSVAITARRFFGAEAWPDRGWAGLKATLSYIATQPDLACVDLLESYAAGPAAVRRSFETRMAFTLFLEEGFRFRPEAEGKPHICAEAIAGAIHELFRLRAEAGETERMVELLPQAAYLALAPFLGAAAAIEFVQAKVREERGEG